jgi:lipopolysaccharide biosynthesis glycosyltransferase
MRAAVMVSTRNLYKDLGPPIKALLVNSDVEKIYLFLEDDDPGVRLPPECEILNVAGYADYWRRSPNATSGWTYMVLMRALFHKLIPEERVLSLDLDAFVLKDVSHLWRMDMRGKLVAGVRETTPLDSPQLPYFNMGFVMLNLDYLRSTGAGDEIERALMNRYLQYPEQHAYNYICGGSVLWLPREYNAGIGTEPYGDPIVRHFMAESKTYRQSEIYRHFAALPWEEIRHDT